MARLTYPGQTWLCISFTVNILAVLATLLTPTHAASLGSLGAMKPRYSGQQFTMRDNAFTSLCPSFDTVRECCTPNDKTQSQQDHELMKRYEIPSASVISEAQAFARWSLGVNSRVQYYAAADCQSCPDNSADVPEGTKPFCCLPTGQFPALDGHTLCYTLG